MKIVQLLFAPQTATWQGVLLGLGDDGTTYREENGQWAPYIQCPKTSPVCSHHVNVFRCTGCGVIGEWDDWTSGEDPNAHQCDVCSYDTNKINPKLIPLYPL